jgi:hypothetical protein
MAMSTEAPGTPHLQQTGSTHGASQLPASVEFVIFVLRIANLP